ncbi:hypothetical protein [Paraflavitalea sp. CAU 1676]|uniref:hypothetical protein n=1 Tax=Paraflavitalea sp. CAU 1676 TaxID=3032598 RepID=UPI0023DBA483|nr:hypothetical protein [Paraflavitalea sp. CAU 1676]MDF2190966.1 hypothetical protein [Paraflavitalea sp. CAU 1676]
MKKIVCIFFACVCAFVSPAQTPAAWFHYAEEFHFVKEVPATSMQGKNFRYEIAVKSNPSDSLSKVRIHGIGVGSSGEPLTGNEFTIETREEQDWTVYTVVGTVRADAQQLWFYASVNGNGNFYFDDISFYLEESPGKWKQLTLFNPSFEEKQADIFAGYQVNKRRSATVQTMLSAEVVKTGHHSLLVKTRGAAPAMATALSE